MFLKGCTRVIGLTVGLVCLPTAAYAASASSGDGIAYQNREQTYTNGAKVGGSVRSYVGNPIYLSGKVALNNCGDADVGRYTTNTTNTSFVYKGGTISTILYTCRTVQGVKSRLCTDRNNLPDPCGADSGIY